jgi:general secretion pathway protein G
VSAAKHRISAFSLVELVVVIVIIGIVAAIAVPRVSRGSKGAAEAAVRGNLAALRAAIDLYAIEHEGVYPGKNKNTGASGGGPADLVAQLTQNSHVSGRTGKYNAASGVIYGPYLRTGMPILPVPPGEKDVLFDADSPPTPDGSGGWVYNPDSGEIRANTTATDEVGTPFSEY